MRTTKEPSNILVAVDGSKASIRAADYAFAIAAKYTPKCTIYLLHVIPPKIYMGHTSGYFGVFPLDFRREIEEEAKKWFTIILAKVRRSNNLCIIEKVITTDTSITAEISKFAERNHIDLMFAGATGTSGLSRLLLGSVSTGLVTHSHCQVMIVR